MPLTDREIKNTEIKDKGYKLADEKGLYVLVKKAGKYFRMNYRYAGKQKTLTLGVYPEVSLKEAREKRDDARKLLADGVDPLEHRKTKKLQLIIEMANTFKAVASEWYEKFKNQWCDEHAYRKWAYLENDIFPTLGNIPIKNIGARELLTVLEKIQARGAIDTAHRLNRICGEIFKYGIRTCRCERDPSRDIEGALIPKQTKHIATITDTKKVGELLRAIDGYNGDISTRCALRMAPYVMLRPGEIRYSEWAEIDFDKKQMRIPAEKMKMRREHIVPLSEQVIAILREIQPVTGEGKYVFPSMLFTKGRPISGNTINAALRRLGFSKDEIAPHGFRSMASTLLYESNKFKSEVIEMQLAHVEQNRVKAAYNRAEYLQERTEMMTWWANYLDSLREAKPSS